MKYVITGGGPAGIFAVEAIRQRDRSSPIVIVTDEGEIARSPVMLTYWIGGEAPREGIRFRDASWAEMNRVDPQLNRRYPLISGGNCASARIGSSSPGRHSSLCLLSA